MKIRFEDLEYQNIAVKSIVDIFKGQETFRNEFTIETRKGLNLSIENHIGTANTMILQPENLLANLNEIQARHALEKTERINIRDYNFSIEMETGTGKTFVYIKTIMELNKQYDFNKFIIVVPSIAIKEGVFKTFEITKEYFEKSYEKTPYDYYIYDSKSINLLRNFATNNSIQILIMTIDAFNKSTNVINTIREQPEFDKPIDYIKNCNPIVIMDEPQNMETAIAKEAIKSLNPLCTLRYSATHKDKYNPVYKLDSIDAYNNKLVKQIEVASVKLPESHNNDYIRVMELKTSKNGITGKLEMDIRQKGKTVRKVVTVKKGDFLDEIANRDIYDGYKVMDVEIDPLNKEKSYIDLSKIKLRLGQENGGYEPEILKRLQIRKTIVEHLEKQLRLKKEKIKVLSLFFIDKVSNYRIYDTDGNQQKGKFAKIFEEEYKDIIGQEKYKSLLEDKSMSYDDVTKVHDGYFSIDKKKTKSGRTYEEYKDTKGTTQADEDTFNKIMKDKEKLLSFKEPLAFIFSHSTLKEGWDNPNVFQICTLNETKSEMKKRQEIGRGLRIAVNQDGERVQGFDVNTLTVMANESYEEFVAGLQNEMEKEEGLEFGIVKNYIFSNILINDENGNGTYLGHEKSEELYKFLEENDYIDKKGKALEKLKIDIENNDLKLPKEFLLIKEEITTKLKTISQKLEIKNADKKEKIEINKQVYLSPDFKMLWDKIKYKTTYRVNFSEEDLIKCCIERMEEEMYTKREKVTYTKTKLEVTQGGIETSKEVNDSGYIEMDDYKRLPDIVTYLQNETNLTRRAIVTILKESKFESPFRRNPQLYIEKAVEVIKNAMRSFIIDGISYKKIGDDQYYCQELFEEEELIGYLQSESKKDGNMALSNKSPYEYVVYDSNVEKDFVELFENNNNVLLYAKLPGWFKIDTPLGKYNPDWAVLINENLDSPDSKKLYFVYETKGSSNEEDLREIERNKMRCGEKHFEALKTGIIFKLKGPKDDLF